MKIITLILLVIVCLGVVYGCGLNDTELLMYIDLWAQGYISNSELLYAIDLWAPNYPVFESHLFAVENDTDGDYLKDTEETSIGYNLTNPDEDNNSIYDGIDLTIEMYGEIDQMSHTVSENHTYRIDYPSDTVTTCPVCCESVVVGHVYVINPLINESVMLTDMALHFMENGSFTHINLIYNQRVDVVKLYQILYE